MEILLGLIFVYTVILWLYFKNVYNYWARRGVVGPKPWPIVGNYGPCLWGNVNESDLLFKIYHQYPKEKCVGIYRGMTPVLLLRDPLLIKHALEKNIQTFFCRTEKTQGIIGELHLGGKNYEMWKTNRKNLSTLFSNSNLDNIIPVINEQIEMHKANIENAVTEESEIDIHASFKRFYIDSIFLLCLGISFKELPEGSKLEKLPRKVFKSMAKYSKLSMVTTTFPILQWPTKYLSLLNFNKFKSIVKNVLKETKLLDKGIDTFSGRLVYIKDKIVSALSNEDMHEKFDEDFIVHNFLVMLVTTEGIMYNFSNAILELAHDQEAQETAYQEIIKVLKKNDGKLNVKSIFDMNYLHEIQEEVARLNSKIAFMFRKCEREFEFPGLNFSIDKNAVICAAGTPILSDPQYFEKPDLFKPERYSADNIRKMKNDGTDLSFGFGPRMCFARRYTKFMVTLGFIMYLQKYKFEPSAMTKHRLDLDEEDYKEPKQYMVLKQHPAEIWVKIKRRQADNIFL